MRFAKAVLWVFGIVMLIFGGWALFAPASMASFLKFGLTTPGAITEVRAFYGGVEIGLGVFWIMGAVKPDVTRAALWSMALVWGAVVVSRSAGILIDDSLGTTMMGALGTELLAVILAAVALRRLRTIA